MKIQFYWSNLIGLSRSFLAIGTLLTILFNPIEILINFNSESIDGFLNNINIFYLFKGNMLYSKLISIVVLVLVISGFYPRITGILHWYVTYSFFSSCSLIDGGDHVAVILTFLLIPITLTDKRRNHWDESIFESNNLKSLVGKIFFTLIKIQVCAIYFHAFVGKIPIEEWLNGTATYYWITHEYFGINEFFLPFYKFFLSNKFIIVFFTWGTIIFEFVLSGMILSDNTLLKKKMFSFAVLFHFIIFINHGLASFFFSMISALLLYLLPLKSNVFLIFKINNVKRFIFNNSI